MKIWAAKPSVVAKTIALFGELASGFSSVKLLYKIDAARQLLREHDVAHLPFLNRQENLKLRTEFNAALCRLFFAEENPSLEADFDEFMVPYSRLLSDLSNLGNLSSYRNDSAARVRILQFVI